MLKNKQAKKTIRIKPGKGRGYRNQHLELFNLLIKVSSFYKKKKKERESEREKEYTQKQESVIHTQKARETVFERAQMSLVADKHLKLATADMSGLAS